MQRIDSLDDARLHIFHNLREQHSDAASSRLFKSNESSIVIVESEKVIRKALDSNVKIVAFLALSEYHQRLATELDRAEVDDNKRFIIDEALLSRMVGYHLHQGVLLAIEQPPSCALDELDFPLIVLNSLMNSENVGAIIRSARAFGIRSLMYDQKCSHPWLRRSIRVLMGAIFGMKLYCSDDLQSDLHWLHLQRGLKIYAAELHPESVDIARVHIQHPAALILGSEGYGVDPQLLSFADQRVHIPIDSAVDSLNVSAAASILCHHLRSAS